MADDSSSIAASLPPGSQLAQYKLLRAVGTGGMGVVYLAKDQELDRDAAVKVLKLESLTAEGHNREMLHQRFLREARSAARLNHPNVAAVYQVGRDGDGKSARIFIAMEWLPGGSLWDHLKHNVFLDWRDATAAVRDAALGLAAAHSAGIIHRDIKPSNLMRTMSGAVKLVDFGLARELEAVSELTQAGSVLGTPTYLSPEQCRGEPATPLSDLYSLGCTYFHLLASRPPFEAPNIPNLLYLQINEPLPDIRRFADDVPPAVAAIVARACAKTPADRFASSAEMADALSASLSPTTGGAAATAFPDTVRVAVPADPPNNLPGETSSFIGRELELAEVTASLSASRLTTLLGAGGTGKTRLSIQTARRAMRAFPDGVWLVELAAVADAPAIAQVTASAIGLKESSGRSFADALRDHLRDRSALLVVDNCEHVVDAAASVCASLLESCPKLRILATSRIPLRTPGEAVIRVPSLPTPSAEDLSPAELEKLPSARLFAERARSARAGFAITPDNARAVAQICRRLDGIPLAIELAAARAKVLSAPQIADRLGDAFRLLTGGARTLLPRQQTLRALIDWSYDLLDARTRLALARCSVFSGGWTLEGAEAVLASAAGLGAGAKSGHHVEVIESFDVLDLLTELVEQSLVIADERDDAVRYRMLETIRQYATEKLAQVDDPIAARHRHVRYCLDFMTAALPKMHGTTQAKTLALLRADHDNLRAALDHAIQDRLVPEAVRLGAALAKFWNIEGQLGDGMRKVSAIVALDPPENLDLARLLDFGGVLAMYYGEPKIAAEWFERALTLAKAAGDRTLISSALNNLSTLAKEQGELQRSYDLSRQALEHRIAVGDPLLIAGSYNNTGNIARAMGRTDEARELLRKSMAIVTQAGDTRWIAYSHLNLGELEIEQGNADVALPLYRRCHEILGQLDEEWGLAYAEEGLGKCLLTKGDLAGARRHFEKTLAVCRKFGDKATIADQLDLLARIALQQGNADSALSLAAEGATLRVKINDRTGIASSLEMRAAIVAKDDPAKAAGILGAADQERRSRGLSLSPTARRQVEALSAELKSRLGEEAFGEAFSRGAAMDGVALLES